MPWMKTDEPRVHITRWPSPETSMLSLDLPWRDDSLQRDAFPATSHSSSRFSFQVRRRLPSLESRMRKHPSQPRRQSSAPVSTSTTPTPLVSVTAIRRPSGDRFALARPPRDPERSCVPFSFHTSYRDEPKA